MFMIFIRDKDQDASSSTHYAQQRKGGGWYRNCCYHQLFGYHTSTPTENLNGYTQIGWHHGGTRGNSWLSWKEAKMVIVPK